MNEYAIEVLEREVGHVREKQLDLDFQGKYKIAQLQQAIKILKKYEN